MHAPAKMSVSVPVQQQIAGWGVSVTTSYYTFGGQREAMRRCTGTCSSNNPGTMTWIHADMLGSASITSNANGTKTSELRYKPFGEVRYSNGTTLCVRLSWTVARDRLRERGRHDSEAFSGIAIHAAWQRGRSPQTQA